MQDPTFWDAFWAFLTSWPIIVLIVIVVGVISVVEKIEKRR